MHVISKRDIRHQPSTAKTCQFLVRACFRTVSQPYPCVNFKVTAMNILILYTLVLAVRLELGII